MGRKNDEAMLDRLNRRLEPDRDTASSSTPPKEAAAVLDEPAPSKPKKKPAREDKHFIGFYAETEMKEKLRVLAFETRRQHQDLMQEAMTLLFARYGSNR